MAMACASLWQPRSGTVAGREKCRERVWAERAWHWRAGSGVVEVRGSGSQRAQKRITIGSQSQGLGGITEVARGGLRCSSWLKVGGRGGGGGVLPAGGLLLPLDMAGERRGARLKSQASVRDAAKGPGLVRKAQDVVHLLVSLGIFIGLDKALKEGFAAASIRFPSALFGMFCLFIFLTLIGLVRPSAASSIVSFFQPANTFIQRWLPLFYVPSLVMIPLAVKGIPASEGAKCAIILVGGWVTTLAVAGYTAVTVRRIVKTELKPAEPTSKPAPFSPLELKVWGSALLLSFAFAVSSPTALGTVSLTAIPFLISATVVGYMLGTSLPADVRKVFHPIIVCAASADLAAYLLGAATGLGFETALGAYLTKVPGNPGAGDVLMGFLGSVILSFAFSMYKQRKLVQRHAAEIFTTVAASSLYALYTTAAAGRLLGLEKSFTAALIPRSVTVALALPIANLLEATNTSLVAACVVLTGLIGANFSQALMDRLGLNDPISRGMATASSGHGLGTAALSAKEPEALPFCAIAYALTGIFCSVICTFPIVRGSLLAIAGG